MAIETSRQDAPAEIRETIAIARTVHPLPQFSPVGDGKLEQFFSFPIEIGLSFSSGTDYQVEAFGARSCIRRYAYHCALELTSWVCLHPVKQFRVRCLENIIALDPAHDQPEVLAAAAKTWNADSRTWRFLTGPVSDVKQMCARFGVDAWTDEGLMTHSLHTIVVNRQGKLAANLEDNQFTPRQLGDLVETVIKGRNSGCFQLTLGSNHSSWCSFRRIKFPITSKRACRSSVSRAGLVR